MSSFVHFIAAAAPGVTPPSPGAVSLFDTISVTAYPFATYGPICVSRDGYTVFALGNDNGQLGVWVWRWNGTAWPNLQILHLSTSGDATGMTPYLDSMLRCNEDGSKVFLAIRSAASGKGVVYVFHESAANTWAELQRIANPTGTADRFGYSIACDDSGDRFVVGAAGYDTGTFDPIYGNPVYGRLYFYHLSGTYTTETTLDATHGMWSGGPPGLGDFVAMSGDGTVVISGDNDFTDSFIGIGNLESFTRSGSTWSQVARVAPTDDVPGNVYSLVGKGVRLTSNGSDVYAVSDQYDRVVRYSISAGAMTYSNVYVGPLDTDTAKAYSVYKHMGMSDDGTIFQIGMPEFDGTHTDQGRVSRWVSRAYVSSETYSPAGVGHNAGRCVDLSADGSIAVWTVAQVSGGASGPGDRVYAKVY